ncbi:Eukaryotic translation initiation factor 3 subunit B [Cardamine amara subsp. amara]|uniref:Eukaryotic translation initiation factor 3 subunit B n=1 Tax=Cardamine amara subsp. amara TaxID=228776 RepID=A0ABD1AXX5_CARAN
MGTGTKAGSSGIVGSRKSNRIKSNAVSEKKKKKKKKTVFNLCNFKPLGVYEKSDYYEPTGFDYPFNVEKCLTGKDDLNQLVIRNGTLTRVLQINPTLKKSYRVYESWDIDITGDAHWSPRGSYLLLQFRNLVKIEGDFRHNRGHFLMRYGHAKANLLDFSPGEKYLITYNRPKRNVRSDLKIFDVSTGRILMGGYHCPADVSWPLIRWAGGEDDSYFAMLIKKTVRIYETQTFVSLGDKFDDVVDMCWSPTESILALLKRSGKQTANKVVLLVKIPNMKVLRQTDVVCDDDCKLYWQSNGKYLAVQVTSSEFVFFRIREGIDDTPSKEVLKVDEKILAFAWEPSGDRFAMIHGDESKPLVSFYSMQAPKYPDKVSRIARFQTKQADSLFWSPRGKHIVLAGLKGSFNGKLEFFDVDNLKVLSKDEHFMATDIAWDPTGRYVATAYTIPQEMDISYKCGFSVAMDPPNPKNGFCIWSLEGKKLYWKSTGKDLRLLQLKWRPNRESIDDDMLKTLAYSVEEEWHTDEDSEDER